MKYLAIVRHGNYNEGTLRLSASGRADMEQLGPALKFHFDKGGVKTNIILTSSADRAVESAEVIAPILGCPIERHELLWSENGRPPKAQKVLTLIDTKADTHDAVILVTHLEYSETLPAVFGMERIHEGIRFPRQETNKGEAWLINIAAHTCTRVRPDL